jgi:hypothetical protein
MAVTLAVGISLLGRTVPRAVSVPCPPVSDESRVVLGKYEIDQLGVVR